MKQVRPKKSLGQHFLTDLSIAEAIGDTLSNFSDYPILEVGPGMGVLSDFLFEKYPNVTLIELDRESVPYLKDKYPSHKEQIIEGDFLAMNLRESFKDPFCVIGNYPYNISSQIFFRVVEHRDLVRCCSGMIQKEVAERLASKAGKKTFGILSVFIQAWYDVEYLFTVDETVFNPPPKVKSAVVRLTRNDRETLGCNEKLFRMVVKASFNQRRKTLRNSLRQLTENNTNLLADEVFNKRPEQLDVDQFIALTNRIEAAISCS